MLQIPCLKWVVVTSCFVMALFGKAHILPQFSSCFGIINNKKITGNCWVFISLDVGRRWRLLCWCSQQQRIWFALVITRVGISEEKSIYQMFVQLYEYVHSPQPVCYCSQSKEYLFFYFNMLSYCIMTTAKSMSWQNITLVIVTTPNVPRKYSLHHYRTTSSLNRWHKAEWIHVFKVWSYHLHVVAEIKICQTRQQFFQCSTV